MKPKTFSGEAGGVWGGGLTKVSMNCFTAVTESPKWPLSLYNGLFPHNDKGTRTDNKSISVPFDIQSCFIINLIMIMRLIETCLMSCLSLN